MWDCLTNTIPKAKKQYDCEAAQWLLRVGLTKEDCDPADWALIKKAEAEGFKINIGDRYIKTKGKWEGEFCVFRARPELHRICEKYDIYSD